jgi:hypothetical protein
MAHREGVSMCKLQGSGIVVHKKTLAVLYSGTENKCMWSNSFLKNI